MLSRQMRLSVLNIEFTSKSIYLQVIKKQKRLTDLRGDNKDEKFLQCSKGMWGKGY